MSDLAIPPNSFALKRCLERAIKNKETAQQIDLDALDKLCKLFDCEVGELHDFRPEE
jgi:DNA-binding Xre family transcriptional regulator